MSSDPRIARGLERQFARRRELIAEGRRPLGWKVGFGSAPAMKQFGLTAPMVGFMMTEGRLDPGATVPLGGWAKPAAEPEIAAHIGRDLGAGADAETVAAAIAGLGPAIELVDVTFPPEDVEEILAADIYHRHVVLGPCDTGRAGARLDGMVGHVRRNGEAMATVTDLEANTGRILDLVRQVADTLAGVGEALRAGEVVICGSITPPIFPEAGDRVLDYDLEPLGSISVRFS